MNFNLEGYIIIVYLLSFERNGRSIFKTCWDETSLPAYIRNACENGIALLLGVLKHFLQQPNVLAARPITLKCQIFHLKTTAKLFIYATS